MTPDATNEQAKIFLIMKVPLMPAKEKETTGRMLHQPEKREG
jgi:hypothetical protein